MSEKPFGGQIKYCVKRPISDEEKRLLKEEYGEDDGLGYVVTGRIQRFGWSIGHTSYVVARNGAEIETRNTRYVLVGGDPEGESENE